MYLFGQDKAKVGIVTVVKRQGSYKLRFQYPSNTSHEFAIAKITPEGWQEAIIAAQLIDLSKNLWTSLSKRSKKFGCDLIN